jgi:hypothetical protein
VEHKVPRGAREIDGRPERYFGEAPLQRSAGHARGQQQARGVLGRGGNGEYPAIAFGVGMRRIGQDHDHILAGPEVKGGRPGQRECHRAFGHFVPRDKLRNT